MTFVPVNVSSREGVSDRGTVGESHRGRGLPSYVIGSRL